ncbi:hypothetical protein K701_14385 [Streptomyces fradiae ATCC 10745 = DSM 40063]|uniref:Uncharacterized protein n=1 Tax=Streptomyces fradiae ATCC 10745 = DSM 40063 TaxID=1319510 RepID=A0ABQ6XUL6_STRFR|nr:hypothetical protein K701_14385 [Streptomyces fradiae ATCC 10745 = DSM 40063]
MPPPGAQPAATAAAIRTVHQDVSPRLMCSPPPVSHVSPPRPEAPSLDGTGAVPREAGGPSVAEVCHAGQGFPVALGAPERETRA